MRIVCTNMNETTQISVTNTNQMVTNLCLWHRLVTNICLWHRHKSMRPYPDWIKSSSTTSWCSCLKHPFILSCVRSQCCEATAVVPLNSRTVKSISYITQNRFAARTSRQNIANTSFPTKCQKYIGLAYNGFDACNQSSFYWQFATCAPRHIFRNAWFPPKCHIA